jgi:hypothetical protein
MSFAVPGGEWEVACDAKGATMGQTMSGKISVPAKSGLVLFKQ